MEKTKNYHQKTGFYSLIFTFLCVGSVFLPLSGTAMPSLRVAIRADSTVTDTIAPLSTITVENVLITAQNQLQSQTTICGLLQTDMPILAKMLTTGVTGEEPAYTLFTKLPNVSVTSDAGGMNGYAYMRFRGIDQSRLNISLNGVPLNDPEDQNFYFGNFPDLLTSMQEVSLQQGAASIQNGAANYGGSLALQSYPLNLKGGSVYANYGSYNTYRVGASYGTGLMGKAAFYGRFSKTHSDGYKEHSSNDGYSGTISAGYFGVKNTLKLTAIFGSQSNQLAWLGAPQDSIRKNPRYNANSKLERDNFKQVHTQLYYAHEFTPDLLLQTCLYANYNEGGYTFDANNFYGAPNDGSIVGYLQTASYAGGYVAGKYNLKNLVLRAGFHGNSYYRNHIGTFLQRDTLTRTYANTGTKTDLSTFLTANYKIKKIELFANAQYRYANFSYQGNVALEPIDWKFLNTSLGATYTLSDDKAFYYSFSIVNREPSRIEMFAGYDDLTVLGGVLQFKNLASEKVLDHEIGFKYKNKQTDFKVNGYYMDFKHENVPTGEFNASGLPSYTLAENSYRLGLELSLKQQVGRYIRFENYSSLSKNIILDVNSSLTPVLTPAFILNQWLYAEPIKGLEFGVCYHYQTDAYIDYYNRNKIKGFGLLNLLMAYTYKQLTASFRLNNVTDERYYSNGGLNAITNQPVYFVQLPANYNVGVNYRF